ncbi:hypothetical protein ACIP5N_06680 [Streptomyces sp. NPDC088768]|uniref:hypothetical protein n=1 Tax=Streptomyces sp. NPDC088768 TaxID=3365894 RepID=UPI003827BE9B
MSTASIELARFFTLAGQSPEDAPMPGMFSGAVDAEWHRVLNQPEYRGLCLATAGKVLVHVPLRGSGPVAWVGDYEKQWGALPEIWFTDENGVVDRVSYDAYRKTGDVVAAWDCGPAGGGDGDDLVPGVSTETTP